MCNVDDLKLYTLDSLPFPIYGRVCRPTVASLGFSLTKSNDPTWVSVQSQSGDAAFRVIYGINAAQIQRNATGLSLA